ncbi:MAG: GGDEF domain-containing response regulator [Actinomycetota bacterium]
MSEDPSEARYDVLVVEDDEFLARLLDVELSSTGYTVRVAYDGEQGLEAAFERCPDLVLADVMMPRMDGFEMVRRLRGDPRTEAVSIILVTARGLQTDKLTGLTAGADDYVVKPFDNEELLARVAGVLRRAEYMKSQSPLTGLPGNVRIEDEIQARVELRHPFAVLYLDLDNFKAFSDRYGFVRGDEALRATGHLIRDTAKEVAGAGTFVGHIGGDDFVVVCDPERAEAVAREVIARFDRLSPTLYDEEDRRRGAVEAEDRQGRLRRFPLLSVSIGIATTESRTFGHRAEAVEIATELKNFAKREPGSSYAVDRRRA